MRSPGRLLSSAPWVLLLTVGVAEPPSPAPVLQACRPVSTFDVSESSYPGSSDS
jgi:hypothetical protein